MSNAQIKFIKAREILDSRGNPTIETEVLLASGDTGTAAIPSGSSIGKHEALELRDGDQNRFNGMGVLKAVENVNKVIAPVIIGSNAQDQLEIDKTLINLDGTVDKSKLGANSLLSVSQAVCEAAAASEKVENFEHISHLYGLKKEELKVPIPIFNLINGGKHGAGNLDFQEFHIVPFPEKTYTQALEMGEEVYQTVKKVLIRHGAIHSVGDEGGFAPDLFTNLSALDVLSQAVKEAGYQFQRDLALGLDVAAGSFYENNRYKIRDRTTSMDAG